VSDLEVISFRPEPEQYAWTFGGAAPVKRIRTPAVLEVYTEDCFAGRVRSEQDLVSQVCEFPYLNPQTGPFHIEGAEPGALLSLGDGHARQGEGETCGVAVECAMNTVLIVDLIKGVPCPWPRLESDTHIMSAGSARPLEDAFRIAQHDMVTWVAALCGLDPLDAYQLVTQAVESPLANVCDTNYTSIAKMAKRYLAPGPAMDGAHARLRELAGEYRS
jgi:acetamidase/formamidase